MIKTLLQQTIKDHVEIIVINPDKTVKDRVSRTMPGREIKFFDDESNPQSDFFKWYVNEE